MGGIRLQYFAIKPLRLAEAACLMVAQRSGEQFTGLHGGSRSYERAGRRERSLVMQLCRGDCQTLMLLLPPRVAGYFYHRRSACRMIALPEFF